MPEISPVDLYAKAVTSAADVSSKKASPQDAVESFSQILQSAMDNINNTQNEANEMMKKLAAGQIENLHEVMLAVERANLTLSLSMQIRNKIIEAYQEISRTQI